MHYKKPVWRHVPTLISVQDELFFAHTHEPTLTLLPEPTSIPTFEPIPAPTPKPTSTNVFL